MKRCKGGISEQPQGPREESSVAWIPAHPSICPLVPVLLEAQLRKSIGGTRLAKHTDLQRKKMTEAWSLGRLEWVLSNLVIFLLF